MQKVHINFTGGIVSPGHLEAILQLATAAHVTQVRFGLRQQLRLEVDSRYCAAFLQACHEKGIAAFKTGEAPPNVMSSYPAADLFTGESWMREGVYKDIFALFDYTPHVKINICDSRQQFVPFYTGHINWVSSASQHYWHLYIRFPKTKKIFRWPELIYTNDVAKLSAAIEKALLQNSGAYVANASANGDALYNKIKASFTFIGKPGTAETHDDFSLPYYEGFNRVNDRYWLGIYRRDEAFSVSFLLDVCRLCLDTRIGQLYTTPWKSLVIKGIEPAHRKRWDRVLGQYRINVRHAANELAWQVEDDTEKGLQLKAQIIRHFDKEDVRTYGLCFAVQTKPTASLFGSVIIRKQQNKNPHRLKALERYDLLYRKDFSPNASEEILFREGVEKDYLGVYLASLCKFFYEDRTAAPLPVAAPTPRPMEAVKETTRLHQCPSCRTVYVPALGDEAQGVPRGTLFHALPEAYSCALCEAPKSGFVEVADEGLLLVG